MPQGLAFYEERKIMFVADSWKEYALLDCGDGEKYEQWGNVKLLRPDPQAIWPMGKVDRIDAHYIRSKSGGGAWDYLKELPESWIIQWKELSFIVRPTGFKHTGLFPEQAVNWAWMQSLIRSANRPIRVLNLFAYTGGATLACLSAGAEVVHVDAAKGMVAWAKENAATSGLSDAPIRWIVDDALKFVLREARRGRQYDAIIMDPPSYGRGPNGEMWKIEQSLYSLVEACVDVLSDDPLFFLLNAYTTGLAASVLSGVLQLSVGTRFGGQVSAEEVVLPVQNRDIVLPCGSSGRWFR